MRVERSYLVRIVQVYEGEPPTDWAGEPFVAGALLDSERDEHVCNHWKLLSDEEESLDDDGLSAFVIQPESDPAQMPLSTRPPTHRS